MKRKTKKDTISNNATTTATENAAPKRRKSPATKANTRARAATGGKEMKMIGQASKALARASKILSQIKGF